MRLRCAPTRLGLVLFAVLAAGGTQAQSTGYTYYKAFRPLAPTSLQPLREANGYWSPVFENGQGFVTILPEVIVRFNSGVSSSWARATLDSLGVVVESGASGLDDAYRVRMRVTNAYAVLDAANALAKSPNVIFAEPNARFTGGGTFTPNDPSYSVCWGLHNTGQLANSLPGFDVDAPEAWDRVRGDSRIKILVIDTGVQQDHPDIDQLPGHDVTTDAGNGGPVNSNDNHGTAVAGVVGARTNNGLGTSGLAFGSPCVSVRTFITQNPQGGWSSQTTWTTDALEWGRQQGVRVTLNSNYYSFQSAFIAEKYAQLRDLGIVHVASSGNNGEAVVSYPAQLPSVLAVGAITNRGVRASYSNHGPNLALVAPGSTIYTTDRTGARGYSSTEDYVFLSGTSYSAPFVAGAAALVLSANRFLLATHVEAILEQNATDLGPTGRDDEYGHGLLNADRAVARAKALRALGRVVFQSSSGAVPTSVQFDYRREGSTTTFDSEPVTLGAQGAFTVPIPLGNFSLSVKASHWLRRTLNLSNHDGELTNVEFSLVNGDVNGDNSINVLDFLGLRAAFGAVPSSPNWNAGSDLNDDGRVDIADFFVLRAGFGRSGDQ